MFLLDWENFYCAQAGGWRCLKMVLSHDSHMKYRQLLLNALIRHVTHSTTTSLTAVISIVNSQQ